MGTACVWVGVGCSDDLAGTIRLLDKTTSLGAVDLSTTLRRLHLSQRALDLALISFGFLTFLPFVDDLTNTQDDRDNQHNSSRSREEKAKEFDHIHL